MNYKRSFLGLRLAQRGNRRLIVGGWWLATLALLIASALCLRAHPDWRRSVLFGYAIAALLVAASSLTRWLWTPRPNPEKVSAGVRTLFDPAWRKAMRENPPVDEREKREWIKAKSYAYDMLVLTALLALLLHYGGLGPAKPWLREPLLWFMVFIVLNLPQSVYLWSEPDMEIEA